MAKRAPKSRNSPTTLPASSGSSRKRGSWTGCSLLLALAVLGGSVLYHYASASQALDWLHTLRNSSESEAETHPLCLQLVSAHHLETTLQPQARILAILGAPAEPGDALYSNFLKTVSSDFELVLLIAGSSQQQSREVQESTIQQEIAAFSNVFLLSDSSVSVQNYLFLGSTLWSEEEDSAAHAAALDFITDSLDMAADGQRAVILTHNAPQPQRLRQLLRLNSDIISLWAHGDSSYALRTQEEGVLFASSRPGQDTVFCL